MPMRRLSAPPAITTRFAFAFLVFLFVIPAHGIDLVQIYALAVDHDNKLREAEARRNAALESREQGIARLLPTLSISSRITRDSVLSKYTAPELVLLTGGRNVGFWNSYASINLVQPVYHHEYWVQLSQADNRIAEAEANYVDTQQNLILRTAKGYFNVLMAHDTLEFANAEQSSIARQLEQAKARFDVDLGTMADVHEAQAGYEQARAGTIQAEIRLENAKDELREIVGEYPDELQMLITDIPLDRPRPDNVDEWNSLAQQQNLGLIASINRVDIVKKNIELQFSGHLPSIDIVGSAGFTETNRQFGISTEYQQIGMELNIPLFAGGSVNSRVREARDELEAAQANLDGRRRAVTREVKEAFRGVVSVISHVRALEAAVVSAASALEFTQAGFEADIRTMVDVLAEQRNLYRAKRDYAAARYEYIINSLSLKRTASTLMLEDLAFINNWLHRGIKPMEHRVPGEHKNPGEIMLLP